MMSFICQRSPGSCELTIDLGRDLLGNHRLYVIVRGSKSALQRKLRHLLSTLDECFDLPSERILMRDGLRGWQREVIAPSSRQGTAQRSAPALGHIELAKLRPAHIHGVEACLLEHGMYLTTDSLINRILSNGVKHAMHVSLINRDPVALVWPPSAKRHVIVPPDGGAVRDTLNLAHEAERTLHAAIHLIAFGGLNRGEAPGLTRDNVNLISGRLSVVASLMKSRVRGLVLEQPKTDTGRRVIDLAGGSVYVLIAHRRKQDWTRALKLEAYADRVRILAGPSGKWNVPEQFSKAHKSPAIRVDHPKMTVRSLHSVLASVPCIPARSSSSQIASGAPTCPSPQISTPQPPRLATPDCRHLRRCKGEKG